MEYEIFKEKLLAELRDFYGQDADVRTVKDITDDCGKACEGIQISLCQEAERNGSITVNIRALYEKVAVGSMDIYDCIEIIYRELEGRINSNYSGTLERGKDGNKEEKSSEI
jgi:hypothetical protein